MSIKIGDKELIYGENFIVFDKEPAVFQVPAAGGINLTVKLTFTPGESGIVNWQCTSNLLTIDCIGWDRPEGSTMERIAKIMAIDGVPIGFLIGHSLFGPRVHGVLFQLYKGGRYE